MSLPPDPDQWRALIGRGYPIYQACAGHLVIVGQEAHVQARCTCGWAAPDRSGDPHQLDLVVDDVAQHCHTLGVPCPDQARECSECPAHAWRTPRGRDMWWQRAHGGPRLGR